MNLDDALRIGRGWTVHDEPPARLVVSLVAHLDDARAEVDRLRADRVAAEREIDRQFDELRAEVDRLRAIEQRAIRMRNDDTHAPGWSVRQANARVILGEAT